MLVLSEQLGRHASRGKRDFLLARTGGVAQPGDLQRFAGSPAGGINTGWPGKRAEMQPINAVVTAAERTLADLNDVPAILRRDDRRDAILPEQGQVVAVGQFESLRIQNCHVRVEERHAEPHALDFGRDPLALLGVDRVIVHLLIQHHAVDRAVERDDLGMPEFVIRFFLRDLRQCPDAERPQIAQAGRGAYSQRMNAQAAIGRDLEFRLERAVVHRRDLRHLDARRIEQQLLGIGKAAADKRGFDFRAALKAVGRHAAELRLRGGRQGSGSNRNKQGKRRRNARDAFWPTMGHRLPRPRERYRQAKAARWPDALYKPPKSRARSKRRTNRPSNASNRLLRARLFV